MMAREAGAKKVYCASAGAPVRYPNVYGIDNADRASSSPRVAPSRVRASKIGADLLIYQDLER